MSLTHHIGCYEKNVHIFFEKWKLCKKLLKKLSELLKWLDPETPHA